MTIYVIQHLVFSDRPPNTKTALLTFFVEDLPLSNFFYLPYPNVYTRQFPTIHLPACGHSAPSLSIDLR